MMNEKRWRRKIEFWPMWDYQWWKVRKVLCEELQSNQKMFTQWRIIFAFNRKIHFHFATANCIDVHRHLPGDAPELVISQSIASHSLSRRDMKGEGLHKLTASKAFIFSRDVSKLSKRTYREMKLATHKTARTWFWCNEIEALMCNFHRLAMPLICIQKDLDSERRGKINYAGS